MESLQGGRAPGDKLYFTAASHTCERDAGAECRCRIGASLARAGEFTGGGHLLRVRIRPERLVQDVARGGDVARKPFFLGAHEPQHLRIRAVRHGLPKKRIERLGGAVRLHRVARGA